MRKRNRKRRYQLHGRTSIIILAHTPRFSKPTGDVNGLELREGGGVFYLLGESEERRFDAGELRRVLHTLVDRVELDPKTQELTVHYRLNQEPTRS